MNVSLGDSWLPLAWRYVPWPASGYTAPAAAAVTALVAVMVVVIVFGNLLVVFAVVNEPRLMQQRQHWLIVSLALADMLVGLLVMPLTLTLEIVGEWIMGAILCELWLAMDVLFVTASILNLCVISLDRYWSVTEPLTYPHRRTQHRMLALIAVAWSLSLMVSLPPLVGWRRKREPRICELSTDLGYVLYSALLSFYVPVVVLIVAYARIFQITRRHVRRRLKETNTADAALNRRRPNGGASRREQSLAGDSSMVDRRKDSNGETTAAPPAGANKLLYRLQHARPLRRCNSLHVRSSSSTAAAANNIGPLLRRQQRQFTPAVAYLPFTAIRNGGAETGTEQQTTPTTTTCAVHEQNEGVLLMKRSLTATSHFSDAAAAAAAMSTLAPPPTTALHASHSAQQLTARKKLLKAKERQAVVLLGLILTSFVASWLPFFVIYSLGAFGVETPVAVFKVFFWMGYCNSGLNPIIYTVFNQEFRAAIAKQLRRWARPCARVLHRHDPYY